MSVDTLALVFLSIAKLVTYLGVFGLLGSVVVCLAIVPRAQRTGLGSEDTQEVLRQVRRVAIVAVCLLVVAAVARIYAQTYSAFGVEEPITAELMSLVVFESRWGEWFRPHLLAIAIAALSVALMILKARGAWWFVVGAVCVLAATLPATGHAISQTDTTVPWLLQVVHVLAVAMWLGTLTTIVVALRSAAGGSGEAGKAAILLTVFSPLAVGAVAIVASTGVGTAVIYLDEWSHLWETSYGQVLIAKVVLMMATGTVGAYNWRCLKTRLSRTGSGRLLRCSTSVEVVLGCAVLSLTAILVHLPIPGE